MHDVHAPICGNGFRGLGVLSGDGEDVGKGKMMVEDWDVVFHCMGNG